MCLQGKESLSHQIGFLDSLRPFPNFQLPDLHQVSLDTSKQETPPALQVVCLHGKRKPPSVNYRSSTETNLRRHAGRQLWPEQTWLLGKGQYLSFERAEFQAKRVQLTGHSSQDCCTNLDSEGRFTCQASVILSSPTSQKHKL